MDSVGIGEAPDAETFGDVGSHTIGHIAEKMNGLNMPEMEKLGLGNIDDITRIEHVAETNRLFWENARSICWERYDDRTLGNYGFKY